MDDDDDDDESKFSLVDGHKAVESLSRDIQYVENTRSVEHELVTQPAVRGTTVGTRSTVYFTASRSSQLCPPDGIHHVQSGDAVVTTTSTGPPLSHLWWAGDATECVYTSGDPKIQRIADGRNVTNVTLALALRPEFLAFALALKPRQCHPRP